MTTIQEPTTSIRDGVLTAGLLALATHIADHHLPVPIDIATPDYGEPPYIRARIVHAGQQMRWLNTVDVDGEDTEDRGDYAAVTWHVRLPDTGTRIELVGTRSKADAEVSS